MIRPADLRPRPRATATTRRRGHRGRILVWLPPALWLGLFLLVPLFVVAKISLSQSVLAQPPYSPLVEWLADGLVEIRLNLGNYLWLIEDRLYLDAYLESIRIAAVSTVLCLLIGYPMAYVVARARQPWGTVLLVLVVLPFWTSFLLRVYAWIGLLGRQGPINQALLALGLIDEPLTMLQTEFSVYVGIVYSYLPFMILPIYANLVKLDRTLEDAAADLGAPPLRSFLTVTLPLSRPGVIAGVMLVFIPAIGEFVIPALLGGPDTLMIGRVLWDEFFANRDWPVASAVAIAIIVLVVGPIVALRNRSGGSLV